MKEKITNIEIACSIFLIIFSCTFSVPFASIQVAGIDAYIGTFIGCFIGIIPLFILIFIFNYEIDKPLYLKTKILFGKVIGTSINVLFIILFFIIATTTLFNISNFIISQYLTDTPIYLVIAILGVTSFLCIGKGISSITKSSLVYTFIILILFVMASFGLSYEVEIDNLKPILEFGIKNPIIAGINYSLMAYIPIGSILLIPKKSILNYSKSNRYIICTYFISSIMIFFMAFVTSACLGKYLLSLYQYPVYITLKKISVFGFIDRIENFLSVQWIFSSFVSFVIPIYYIKDSIVKRGNNWIVNFIIVSLCVITALLVFKNNTSFNNYLSNIYPYVLFALFLLYVIIFFVIIIKRGIKCNK